jgi:hypothetical protein
MHLTEVARHREKQPARTTADFERAASRGGGRRKTRELLFKRGHVLRGAGPELFLALLAAPERDVEMRVFPRSPVPILAHSIKRLHFDIVSLGRRRTGTAGLTRLIAGMLFEVRPLDPATFLAHHPVRRRHRLNSDGP